jgi:SAM-dependent methyltransferase
MSKHADDDSKFEPLCAVTLRDSFDRKKWIEIARGFAYGRFWSLRKMATFEKDYVLGTHDEEVARLGLQHRAWQPCTLAVWRSAEIGRGQTVLDVGCGPGYAALDLAELVGDSGRVVAIDKSEKFLNVLDLLRHEYGLNNITSHQADLDAGEFPAVSADRAWCRWVFAFLKQPRETLARLVSAIRPGGVIVIHEYFDYATWRTAPRSPELEKFVSAVMASWRDNGGEPDIGLSLPRWLEEIGFGLRSVRPIVDVVRRDDMKWEWLRSFIEVGRRRLVDLGYLTAGDAALIWDAFTKLEATPGLRMITPGVLEIVAAQREVSR